MVLQALPSTVLETALVLFIVSFLIVTILSGGSATEVLPVLGMFAYVGFRLKPSLTQIVDGVNAIRYSAAAIEDVHNDLLRAESWSQLHHQTSAPIALERAIELDGVVFRYPGASVPALAGIDLVINKGTSVGFVGPTGGGKSTLLDVIIGLLDPDEGTVRIDGVDIRTARNSWLQLVGIVSQVNFLLDTSLRRNIAFGVPVENINDDRLTEVLALAKLDEFVASLPAGVETEVGERGVRLSGGQRQRIAIARALYSDPAVIVLDEGTAALDNQTEAELMTMLARYREMRTLLMVAHRLSTVRNCDVIHVVDAGRIVASGGYEELESGSKHFKNLAR
jgi:ATP-binding cassette subfamily C protein